jgi:RNA polymerase primary sigma factor
MTDSKEPLKVLTQAEQESVIVEELQRIIKLAKEKGSMSIEEINEQIPPEILSPIVLDAFMVLRPTV